MAQAKPKKVSVKHLQIDKNQSSVLAVVAVAVALVVFGLFATKALISKGLYQRRAINARHQVVDTLKSNYTSAKTLVNQYIVFAQADPNALGGSATGTGNGDGDNARIVLDALPSTYDAPALATSIEKLLSGRGMTIESLTVTDDPSTYSNQAQAQPKPTSVQFSFEGSTNYTGAQQLLQDFERSIRPFDLNTLEIDGSDANMKLTVNMTTYYQVAKSLDLTPTQEVK